MPNTKSATIDFQAVARLHQPLIPAGSRIAYRPPTTLRWALTAMGITGAALNAFGLGICFTIWIIANIGWIAVNIQRRSWPEAALFSAYLATSILGLFTWGLS